MRYFYNEWCPCYWRFEEDWSDYLMPNWRLYPPGWFY